MVHQRAITPRRRSAVEVRVFTAPKDMIVSQAADVVLLDRSDVEIANAMIPRRQRVVRDPAPFGLATRATNVVLLEVVQTLPLRSVVRTEVVRKERPVARMNAVDRVGTVDRTDTARLVPFPQGPSPRRMRSLQLL